MRLLLLSILFVSAVYVVSGDAPKSIKCYEYSFSSFDKEPETAENEVPVEEKTCDGACKMGVLKTDVENSFKGKMDLTTFNLKCLPSGHKSLCEDKSGRTLCCHTDICFTKDMRDKAMAEFRKTGKITMPSAPSPSANPVVQGNLGSQVFSSTFCIFVAVFCAFFAF